MQFTLVLTATKARKPRIVASTHSGLYNYADQTDYTEKDDSKGPCPCCWLVCMLLDLSSIDLIVFDFQVVFRGYMGHLDHANITGRPISMSAADLSLSIQSRFLFERLLHDKGDK
jgi:hypothetical protein